MKQTAPIVSSLLAVYFSLLWLSYGLHPFWHHHEWEHNAYSTDSAEKNIENPPCELCDWFCCQDGATVVSDAYFIPPLLSVKHTEVDYSKGWTLFELRQNKDPPVISLSSKLL